MEILINYYVFLLFFVTIGFLAMKKKNKKINRYYTPEHKS